MNPRFKWMFFFSNIVFKRKSETIIGDLCFPSEAIQHQKKLAATLGTEFDTSYQVTSSDRSIDEVCDIDEVYHMARYPFVMDLCSENNVHYQLPLISLYPNYVY